MFCKCIMEKNRKERKKNRGPRIHPWHGILQGKNTQKGQQDQFMVCVEFSLFSPMSVGFL